MDSDYLPLFCDVLTKSKKEHEQQRRRKSKAQFFEMIQEIRRYQKEEKGVGDDGCDDDEEEFQEGDNVDDDENDREGNVHNNLHPNNIDEHHEQIRNAVQKKKNPKGSSLQQISDLLQDFDNDTNKVAKTRARLQHSHSTATDLGSYNTDSADETSRTLEVIYPVRFIHLNMNIVWSYISDFFPVCNEKLFSYNLKLDTKQLVYPKTSFKYAIPYLFSEAI